LVVRIKFGLCQLFYTLILASVFVILEEEEEEEAGEGEEERENRNSTVKDTDNQSNFICRFPFNLFN